MFGVKFCAAEVEAFWLAGEFEFAEDVVEFAGAGEDEARFCWSFELAHESTNKSRTRKERELGFCSDKNFLI